MAVKFRAGLENLNMSAWSVHLHMNKDVAGTNPGRIHEFVPGGPVMGGGVYRITTTSASSGFGAPSGTQAVEVTKIRPELYPALLGIREFYVFRFRALSPFDVSLAFFLPQQPGYPTVANQMYGFNLGIDGVTFDANLGWHDRPVANGGAGGADGWQHSRSEQIFRHFMSPLNLGEWHEVIIELLHDSVLYDTAMNAATGEMIVYHRMNGETTWNTIWDNAVNANVKWTSAGRKIPTLQTGWYNPFGTVAANNADRKWADRNGNWYVDPSTADNVVTGWEAWGVSATDITPVDKMGIYHTADAFTRVFEHNVYACTSTFAEAVGELENPPPARLGSSYFPTGAALGDAFNRADGVLTGANWSNISATTQIASNQLRSTAALGTNSSCTWVPTIAYPSEVYFTIAAMPENTGVIYIEFPFVGTTYFQITITGTASGDPTVAINKIVGGGTNLASNTMYDFPAGTMVGFAARDGGLHFWIKRPADTAWVHWYSVRDPVVDGVTGQVRLRLNGVNPRIDDFYVGQGVLPAAPTSLLGADLVDDFVADGALPAPWAGVTGLSISGGVLTPSGPITSGYRDENIGDDPVVWATISTVPTTADERVVLQFPHPLSSLNFYEVWLYQNTQILLKKVTAGVGVTIGSVTYASMGAGPVKLAVRKTGGRLRVFLKPTTGPLDQVIDVTDPTPWTHDGKLRIVGGGGSTWRISALGYEEVALAPALLREVQAKTVDYLGLGTLGSRAASVDYGGVTLGAAPRSAVYPPTT